VLRPRAREKASGEARALPAMSLLVTGASQSRRARGRAALAGDSQGVISLRPGAVVRCGAQRYVVGGGRRNDRAFPPPDEVLDAGGAPWCRVSSNAPTPTSVRRLSRGRVRSSPQSVRRILRLPRAAEVSSPPRCHAPASCDELLALTLARLDHQCSPAPRPRRRSPATASMRTARSSSSACSAEAPAVTPSRSSRPPCRAMIATRVAPRSGRLCALVLREIYPGDCRRPPSEASDVFFEKGGIHTRCRLAACSPTPAATDGAFTFTPTSCRTSAAPSSPRAWAASSALPHLLHVTLMDRRARRAAGRRPWSCRALFVLPPATVRHLPPRSSRGRGAAVALRYTGLQTRGSSHTESMPLHDTRPAWVPASSKAALTAATLNAAAALGRAGRSGSIGGRQAADLGRAHAPAPRPFGLPLRESQPGRHVVKQAASSLPRTGAWRNRSGRPLPSNHHCRPAGDRLMRTCRLATAGRRSGAHTFSSFASDGMRVLATRPVEVHHHRVCASEPCTCRITPTPKWRGRTLSPGRQPSGWLAGDLWRSEHGQ